MADFDRMDRDDEANEAEALPVADPDAVAKQDEDDDQESGSALDDVDGLRLNTEDSP